MMRKQVTPKQNWIRVETSNGTEWVPGELLFVRNSEQKAIPLTDAELEQAKKAIWQYTESEPQEWENVKGFGARLSAPGYLDCTAWTVFETEEEAQSYLDEEYPDDDDDDDEGDEG